ncbi:MAG: hypothetical protein BMS9Abin36_1735 [Gammaproteobacteria bacterium]|nr:MAG: hypothetical protein BMS9Abin36_1735 [Gammaproteobacteria bacterium]
MNVSRSPLRLLIVVLASWALAGCPGGGGGGGGGATPVVCTGGSGVTVSWTANKETAVNTSGGGYVVYFSQSSGFNPGNTNVCSQSVPYVSGSTAPTTTVINPPSGTWYVRVAATSQLNAPGSTGGSESTASSELTVVAP